MSRTLTRPMFRKGGMAQREKYMGGGMTGIMSGITPDAGVTPRVGLQEGTFIRGGGVTQGNPFSTRGIPFRPPATTPPVPAVIPQGPPMPPSKLARILNRLKNIPGAARLGILSRLSPYALAAGTGMTIGQATDFIAKSTSTPEGYARLKEMSGPNFNFDETNIDVGDVLAYIDEGNEMGEKYGFFPRGGKEQRLKDLGLENQFDAKTGKRIKGTTTKNKSKIENIPAPDKKEDPEKSLMDVYDENKGIIDQVMGSADEDTKKSMYLQLAKFGAGLLAQPGGDLVGAIGKAAEKPLEGAEATLAEKRKGERDTKLLALQKTFDDMKEPEQVKLVKAVQKEYGFDTFAEAYDFISKPKKSSAEINAENKFYRETATDMGVSTEGFRREMEKLDEKGFGKYIGNFTRADALLPDKTEDRVNGEYYVTLKGQAVRFVNNTLYTMDDPEFTKKIETKKA
jgi:hypothetical protein